MFNNSTVANPFKSELGIYVRNVNHILLYIQAFICVFGLVGNLLALIVINQKSLRNTSSAVFITYMAIFDSAVLILHAVNLAKPPRIVILLCSLTFLTDLSIFCANWVLVIITLGKKSILKKKTKFQLFIFSLERCVAVYSPFLAKRFCTVHSARYSIYILLTISILFFSLTFPLIYQIKGVSKNDKCHIHKGAALVVRIYQSILFTGIPDILLLSNLFTVYSLCRRRQRLSLCYINDGHKMEMRITDIHSNRKQRQLTIMLVTVSLSFYLFTTPTMIAFITEINPPKDKQIDRIKRNFLFSQCSVVFSELNNAVSLFSISIIIDVFLFSRRIFYSIVLLVNVFDMLQNKQYIIIQEN